MSLKIDWLREEEYYQLGKEVRDGVEADSAFLNAGLCSPSIFGSMTSQVPGERAISIDHNRGYIRLCKPVINFAIAQEGASLLRMILGIDKDCMEEVIDFRTCYDTEMDALVDVATLEYAEGLLWGAEILKKWIDEFDIEQAIEDELAPHVKSFCKEQELSENGELRRATSGGYVVVGDWRFFPESDHPTYGALAEYIGKTVFRSNTSRLSYLINLQGHKERLYSMIVEYVAVPPLGIRPDIDRKHDLLTWAYDDIISANKNLKLVMSGMFDPQVFTDRYKRLSNSVRSLMVTSTSHRKNQKSVLEKLAGKHGDIRDKMLGKRVDYSGRSVITIDPFLSIRNIKLPRDMAPKLFRSHILHSMNSPNPSDWMGMDKRDKCNSKLVSSGMLENIPVVLGRQPTLHKPSMRAFKAELTDERSIRINPLCVTGFNADFDGDQMWVRVPVSSKAVREVNELMSIGQNIYYPKNGECSVMPRQEIIYGLNVCTRDNMQKGTPVKSYSEYRALFDDLFAQKVKVFDTVTLNGYTECAGRVAFSACLPPEIFKEMGIKEITSKSIVSYVESMLDLSVEPAIDCIDRMVELGFKIGYLYPPTLNLLDEDDVSYDSAIDKFHESMREITDFYERGLEEESEFATAYDRYFTAVEDEVKGTIYDRVGRESGFVRLAESGARGSKSNMIQMYGYKGRIQKSSRESFRAVIEHSYAEQLTPLEHFVTAYGGRQGLINKSLNTADTGYAMRKMWHATSPYVITCDDCGTEEGIDIRKSDIAMFTDSSKEIDDIFCKIITGRYLAKDNSYIDKEFAKKLCSEHQVVTIRSVLTCKNPCCKKCYGDDPSTHRHAAIGLPIGFIAAQSIGEPGTQLSMDSFKKGGIASKGGVTSSFAKLDAYIECKDLANNKNFASYDPVAWASGEVFENYNPDGTKTVKIGDSKISKKLPADAPLRKRAVKGQGLCLERGDYDIKELLEYTNVRNTQLYFIHTLYHIYKDECEICMKHFEVLAAAMTMHMVVSTDRDDLYVGQYHDSIQMSKASLDNTIYVSTMKGVGSIQTSRTHMLSRVIMESVKQGLASSLLLGLTDPLEYPLNRIAMGQRILCGGVGEFLTERKM